MPDCDVPFLNGSCGFCPNKSNARSLYTSMNETDTFGVFGCENIDFSTRGVIPLFTVFTSKPIVSVKILNNKFFFCQI